MKNFFLSVAFTAVTAAILQMFAPWWVIVIAAFAIGYLMEQKWYVAFFSGFFGVFLLWIIYAFILSHWNNDILAKKVALLLPFKGNILLLLLATGLVGGLVGGFASLTGKYAAALND